MRNSRLLSVIIEVLIFNGIMNICGEGISLSKRGEHIILCQKSMSIVSWNIVSTNQLDGHTYVKSLLLGVTFISFVASDISVIV